MEPLLSVADLHVRYGGVHALQGISFTVPLRNVVTLVGRNGAGKTTTLNAIMGIGPRPQGSIIFNRSSIAGEPSYRIARAGIGYVPETRGIFPSLSVIENLTVAARAPIASETEMREPWTVERVLDLFPRLAERRETGGGQLSGGEQQMLSIARALLTNPRLLLLDEPTEGLAPVVIEQLEAAIRRLKQTDLSILLVEQNLAVVLAVTDKVLVVGKGRLRWEGTPAEFANASDVKDLWLTV
jgi:branched-chain amino acid transport system ATP-binding protein